MNLLSILESILFVHGEALDMERLARATGKPADDIRRVLGELAAGYEGRGLALVEKDGLYQLSSNPANAPYVEKLFRSEFGEELSRAGLETIAVIAYQGPLTRAEIEYARGVNCSFILRSLLMRGLIERRDNPQDARSYLYEIGLDFLKYMGLARIEDLPRYQELKQELKRETGLQSSQAQRASI